MPHRSVVAGASARCRQAAPYGTVPEILLNGEAREVAAGATVLDLLAELGRDPRTVAVEHNGDILPRERYGATALAQGDRLEIVGFVQGGRAGVEAAELRLGRGGRASGVAPGNTPSPVGGSSTLPGVANVRYIHPSVVGR